MSSDVAIQGRPLGSCDPVMVISSELEGRTRVTTGFTPQRSVIC